jgi:hypothetical protein
MAKIGIIEESDVLDACVIRVPKTYPAYFGSYDRFDEIRDYISQFDNLFLVGRNGMHKYNNQDHSMYTAMLTVENMYGASHDIWSVNVEEEYHESGSAGGASGAGAGTGGTGRDAPILPPRPPRVAPSTSGATASSPTSSPSSTS